MRPSCTDARVLRTIIPSSKSSFCQYRYFSFYSRSFYHDFNDVRILRTGKPIFKMGGGRSSLGGHTVTVFGASGFLGRYIVNRLACSGCTVIVPYRDEMTKRHLKICGDLGRIIFMEFDLRDTQSIEESVRHSDTVYNLIGRDYPTKNFDFQQVHVKGASRIAKAVAKYDVDRFIHISSYNADPNSTSEFYRTKGFGEQAVREIFPETTIVRPSPMVGYEDKLLNKLAGTTYVFTVNNMKNTLRPVHVIDVGKALECMINDDSTASQTYELYGPEEYTLASLAQLVERETLRPRLRINMPKSIMKPAAQLLNRLLWWPIGCGDTIERQFINQRIDSNAKTFADLNVTPDSIPSIAYMYLLGYRSWTTYDLPPMTQKELLDAKRYVHVVDDREAFH